MASATEKKERDKALLDAALRELEREAPDRFTKLVHWLGNPGSRWIRLPLGILCIIASFFWFLPVVGIEFFPIGLLLVAQDVPFLRRPAARLLFWLERKWRALQAWRKRSRR
jgi:membrane-bound ClpP family serine protease